ncbi:MAG: TIGR01777 family oxidoreductase [Pyrinomonadaceae bacterium]|nr:TIGR01777 family oxidoreductase [Pyrinomonadaceae bacterium]
MKILVSGASGLVGTHLIPTLLAKGNQIYKLVRHAPDGNDEIEWDTENGSIDEEKLEDFDAVIHLAGDNVASENWSEEKKRKIRDSRVSGTRILVDALKRRINPPKHFISASAIGFYGNHDSEILNEESAAGKGFLPEVCQEWEREASKAENFGARIVLLRIGVVLSKDGGALAKMLTPFKFGVGGTVGSGKQYLSWIALDDLIKIINFALENTDLRGAINAVAPNAVTNEEFTRTLGKSLNRPTILPIPEFAVKLLFGEMGETLLLEGARVYPQKLLDAKFTFDYANLEPALKHVLK